MRHASRTSDVQEGNGEKLLSETLNETNSLPAVCRGGSRASVFPEASLTSQQGSSKIGRCFNG